jgi:hypothetical protein
MLIVGIASLLIRRLLQAFIDDLDLAPPGNRGQQFLNNVFKMMPPRSWAKQFWHTLCQEVILVCGTTAGGLCPSCAAAEIQ